MGFFLKALAAIATADAIDRHARSRPTKYWYPDQPGRPPTGSHQPHGVDQAAAAQQGWYPDTAGEPLLRWWDGRQWTHHTHALPRAPERSTS